MFLPLPFHAITPFTLQDFPGKMACIIWVGGCNLRCLYCHNPELVRDTHLRHDSAEIFSFLEKRAGKLDGVVISGGEATLWPGLPDFIRQVRRFGYAIKLDTNGTRPAMVRQLLDEHLLDYIALDYKAPPSKFRAVTSRFGEFFPLFSETLSTLCAQEEVAFEVRTTVHTSLLNEADLEEMGRDLAARNYRGTWYIQNFTGKDRSILGALPEQEREIDFSRMELPVSLTIEKRNFFCTPHRVVA